MKSYHSYKNETEPEIKEKNKRYITYFIPAHKRRYGKGDYVAYKTVDKNSFEYWSYCWESGGYMNIHFQMLLLTVWAVYRLLLAIIHLIIWGFKKLFPSLAAKTAKLKNGVLEWARQTKERIYNLTIYK